MLKYFLILIFPILLFANLTYESNHNKEVALLESLNVEPSFIYDPIMNDMLNRQTTDEKNRQFFQAMEDAYLFIPTIKQILSEYKIPAEFLFLAMAESNFSNRAYSHKKAVGLWQFMPATARLYHLKIDTYVDERRDFIKSTKAAAKYLSSLHRRFGKWYLAAIAYNCGGGALNHAIEKAGSDDLTVLTDEDKKYIPRESRYYIRKIVALMLIGNDERFLQSSKYGYLLNRSNAQSVAIVKVPSGESIERVANILKIPFSELKNLNRHLRYNFVPPYKASYEIYIPYSKLITFKKKYKKEPIQKIYKLHIVKKGESLYRLGRKYKVSYKIIKDFNKLKSNRLRLKQKLIIPVKIATAKKSVKKHYYTVKNGDSLISIAKKYKVTLKDLKSKNHLRSSLIKIGERLTLYE